MEDAKVSYGDIQQAYVGYCYGDSTCGQRALYEIGVTGIPIFNVNNNCSTGASALLMAKQAIQGSVADCVLALGFEKMERGSLQAKYNDRTNPLDKHFLNMMEHRGFEPKAPGAAQIFGNAGKEHMEKYNTTKTHFAKIAEKNHRHSSLNPYSQFRDVYTLDQIMKSRSVFDPLTMLQCCPTSDGAAAVVLASEAFVHKHKLENQAVEVLALEMATDTSSELFTGSSSMSIAGYDMSRTAANKAYSQAKINPKQVQVVELHDCFSANELITYEALGLCEQGKAGEMIDNKDNTYGGRVVVNPSGGLISKGHPLGATGLAQCCELVWQLRGVCEKRQVKGVEYALQHNIGLGGAAVVGVYKRGWKQGGEEKAKGGAWEKYGKNPAVDENYDGRSGDPSGSEEKAKL